VVIKTNMYIADELANKVKYLHKALETTQKIVAVLEEENKRLNDALMSLASENKKDSVNDDEVVCV
jgi:hypothetical protein